MDVNDDEKTTKTAGDLLEDTGRCLGLVINAPGVFARTDFMAWLNDPARSTFTWHAIGTPLANEYSDVVVLVDAGHQGDSDDMPNDIWRAICDRVYREYGADLAQANGYHVAVRLTNIAS